ncbi:uncharacterized protein LOC122056965 isoform X5 [Macadamia integrifolia]|uniref:uncharacterized protein LOC122056965 isoform X5 n=1 Tax=Macadamia integrifolia TaxID=60698 RepID=UPI001C52EEA6|nr:uncharacterized protein LOC122056965 isoform X5 [Macadamia integrifolia]
MQRESDTINLWTTVYFLCSFIVRCPYTSHCLHSTKFRYFELPVEEIKMACHFVVERAAEKHHPTFRFFRQNEEWFQKQKRTSYEGKMFTEKLALHT